MHKHTPTHRLPGLAMEDSFGGHRELPGKGQPWAAAATVQQRGPELASAGREGK